MVQDEAESRRGPENMIRKVFLVMVLIVMLFSLVSCQTVQGVGGDIQWIGEKGTETLER